MTLLRTALAAFVIGLALPAVAHGADRFVVRDEPVSATSGLRAREAPLDFNLVGLHWKGPGSVLFRTLSRAGRWSSWRKAAAEAEDLPDAGSAEGAARPGWKLGSPYWTGAATSIQYRLDGRVSRLRAYFVWSDLQTKQANNAFVVQLTHAYATDAHHLSEFDSLHGTPRRSS